MNVLVVLAHPEPRWFDESLRYVTGGTLIGDGRRFARSDLHPKGLDPVCCPGRLPVHADHEVFNVQAAQGDAIQAGTQAVRRIEWVLHPIEVGSLNLRCFETMRPFIATFVRNIGNLLRARHLNDCAGGQASVERETQNAFRHLLHSPNPGTRDH